MLYDLRTDQLQELLTVISELIAIHTNKPPVASSLWDCQKDMTHRVCISDFEKEAMTTEPVSFRSAKKSPNEVSAEFQYLLDKPHNLTSSQNGRKNCTPVEMDTRRKYNRKPKVEPGNPASNARARLRNDLNPTRDPPRPGVRDQRPGTKDSPRPIFLPTYHRVDRNTPVRLLDGSGSKKPSVDELSNQTVSQTQPEYFTFDWEGTPSTSRSPVTPPQEEGTLCLILGTFITEGVNGAKMSCDSTRVINLSKSGYRIGDIADCIRRFGEENPCVWRTVRKIIFSFGTNDIRCFNSFKYDVSKKFRRPIVKVIDQAKHSFPLAQLVFQSVLPIKIQCDYQIKSVHEFNLLLLNLCGENGCIFLDCFSDFLDPYRMDINFDMYWDGLHLNEYGLKHLCRILRYAIYQNIFNPYMKSSICPYYYID